MIPGLTVAFLFFSKPFSSRRVQSPMYYVDLQNTEHYSLRVVKKQLLGPEKADVVADECAA